MARLLKNFSYVAPIPLFSADKSHFNHPDNPSGHPFVAGGHHQGPAEHPTPPTNTKPKHADESKPFGLFGF